MRFHFRRGKSISNELRRIAGEQLQLSIDDLSYRQPDLHTAIHEFRKRCKRLRALLRIVRPNFSTQYDANNKALRDLARDLSYVRDAQALVEALDRLEDSIERRETFPQTRHLLMGRRDAAAGGEAALHRKLETMVPVVRKMLNAAEDWEVAGKGFNALEGGIRKTYGRAREARKRCLKRPTTHNFHEWRKRVKYHWHHALLLTKCCPDFLNPHRELAEQLGDVLGHDHDYSVLLDRLGEVQKGDKAFRKELSALVKATHGEQDRLRARALDLGGFLQAETPEALSKRWGAYFAQWKS